MEQSRVITTRWAEQLEKAHFLPSAEQMCRMLVVRKPLDNMVSKKFRTLTNMSDFHDIVTKV